MSVLSGEDHLCWAAAYDADVMHLEINMGIVRYIKIQHGFASGRIKVVRILEASDQEIICNNGTIIRILDGWNKNLIFGRDMETGKISYSDRSKEKGGIYTILKDGYFIGILVCETEGGDIWAVNILNGAQAHGWIGGGYINYCKHVMASDFAAAAEMMASM